MHPRDSTGIVSILDTDLYKLTMQCALLHSGYGDVDVTYAYTNRTPDLKITEAGFQWLKEQVSRLATLRVTEEELTYLHTTCGFFPETYLQFLKGFRFDPDRNVKLGWTPSSPGAKLGDISISVTGKWAATILYEIPLLVLVCEAYFRYTDTDWNYDGQEERAYEKGMKLLRGGCTFSEFGTRRRRSYATQEMVLRGLMRAAADFNNEGDEVGNDGKKGSFAGTSNVHFAHRFNLPPIGTVAHEWFMGVASITQNYRDANLLALEKWVSCFGPGILGIALTDTFGTDQFLKCFSCICPRTNKTYAETFNGVRQDSGDPEGFVLRMREFQQELEEKIGREIGRKTIVFSDSLNVERCLRYKKVAEENGFEASFGVGTFLTNDFRHASKPTKKSIPLNIVIKISSAAGKPAIKISDNAGKNTGDKKTVEWVKSEIGYVERQWWSEGHKNMGDERFRWGREDDSEMGK